MKIFFGLFFLVLVFSTAAFAADCEPGFKDNISVRALDAKYRPMQGVGVNITYQKDFTTGKGIITSKTIYTDENGTALLYANNIEQVRAKVDCNIVIRTLFQGKTLTQNIVAYNHPNLIDFVYDFYLVTVRVVDQSNTPIKDASVFVNDISKKTDQNGIAALQIPKGNNRILITSEQGKVEKNIDLQNDQILSVGMSFYPILINVKDDNEKPLPGIKVLVDEKEYLTNTEGIVKIERVFGNIQTISAKYGANIKKLDVDLANQNEYSIIFDTIPPIIRSIRPQDLDTKIYLHVFVEDPGKNPSGIDPQGIIVHYRIDSGEQQKATIFLNRRDEYVATLPKPPTGSTIFFTISITDRSENKVFSDGKVTIDPPVKTKLNDTKNISETNNFQSQSEFKLPIELIIGILIVIAVIYFVLQLRKRGESTQ